MQGWVGGGMDGNEGTGQQVQALCNGLPVVPGTRLSMAHSSIYQVWHSQYIA